MQTKNVFHFHSSIPWTTSKTSRKRTFSCMIENLTSVAKTQNNKLSWSNNKTSFLYDSRHVTFFERIQNHDFCIHHYAGDYQHIHPYAWLLLTCGDVDVERCIPCEYTFYLNEHPAHIITVIIRVLLLPTHELHMVLSPSLFPFSLFCQ